MGWLRRNACPEYTQYVLMYLIVRCIHFLSHQLCWLVAIFAPFTANPWASWWMDQSGRNLASYPRTSPGEVLCLAGGFCVPLSCFRLIYLLNTVFLVLFKKLLLLWMILLSSCVYRPGRGGVQLHGRWLYETSGGHSRPASDRWSECHCLQRPAGSHRGHHW